MFSQDFSELHETVISRGHPLIPWYQALGLWIREVGSAEPVFGTLELPLETVTKLT
jgi:hypothetical protein